MTVHSVATEWVVAEEDHAANRSLAKELGIPPLVAHLLRTRGITNSREASDFLDPSSPPLTDPFDLTDMQAAVDRLTRARDQGEHVRVFGDYDVDGISGTALLTKALRRFGIQTCSYAMPERLRDGYGLNPERVAQARDEGVQVLVTVDNGINARDAADAAQECGIDLIITDHHSIEGDLPRAVAIINPKRDAPSSPFSAASGSAVAFKLATALNGRTDDLDLVALGTVADIVPLLRENRTLVALGIDAMTQDPSPGILALARVAGVRTDELRAESIAFQLGPRINAGGRMSDGISGLKLLLTDSPEEAARHARDLNNANEERRTVESRVTRDAEEELEATFHPSQRAIVLARHNWHPGVIGIVASRLQHAYCRPVILIAVNEDGVGRASGRSTPDVDLHEALNACAHLLQRFGGHRAAVGMTIQEKNIEAFKEAFYVEAERLMGPGDPVRKLSVDAQIAFSQIDGRLLNALDRLEPFGHANPAPVFSTYGVEILPGSARELRGGHLRCTLRQDSRAFSAIGFNLAQRLDLSQLPGKIDVAYTPQFNTWRGETTIQIQLKDIRPA